MRLDSAAGCAVEHRTLLYAVLRLYNRCGNSDCHSAVVRCAYVQSVYHFTAQRCTHTHGQGVQYWALMVMQMGHRVGHTEPNVCPLTHSVGSTKVSCVSVGPTSHRRAKCSHWRHCRTEPPNGRNWNGQCHYCYCRVCQTLNLSTTEHRRAHRCTLIAV